MWLVTTCRDLEELGHRIPNGLANNLPKIFFFSKGLNLTPAVCDIGFKCGGKSDSWLHDTSDSLLSVNLDPVRGLDDD
jgi:hypothetical protein